MRLDIPSDAALSWRREWIFLQLKRDYQPAQTTYPSGTLLAIRWDALLRGEHSFDVIFTPTATRSLGRGGLTMTRDYLLLDILDNVAGRLEEVTYRNGAWAHRAVQAPFPGTLSARGLYDASVKEDPLANAYVLNYADFLTPDSLYLGHARAGHCQYPRRR